MEEMQIETGVLCRRIAIIAREVGLSPRETRLLFGSAHEAARHEGGKLSNDERDRALLVLRLLSSVANTRGSWRAVGVWLRSPQSGCQSPMRFISASPVPHQDLLAGGRAS